MSKKIYLLNYLTMFTSQQNLHLQNRFITKLFSIQERCIYKLNENVGNLGDQIGKQEISKTLLEALREIPKSIRMLILSLISIGAISLLTSCNKNDLNENNIKKSAYSARKNEPDKKAPLEQEYLITANLPERIQQKGVSVSPSRISGATLFLNGGTYVANGISQEFHYPNESNITTLRLVKYYSVSPETNEWPQFRFTVHFKNKGSELYINIFEEGKVTINKGSSEEELEITDEDDRNFYIELAKTLQENMNFGIVSEINFAERLGITGEKHKEVSNQRNKEKDHENPIIDIEVTK